MTEPTVESPLAAIDIMLVSHTNAGKTTLVRTLLGRDVGEVADAPDVTKAVVAYDLAAVEGRVVLRLWDTPGFGDSFRLVKRLGRKHRWIAWMVRELWDRWRNPRLWRSQHLALDLRQRASVILYLVNSLERPVDAVYVGPELDVLAWIGKPVLVILNQGGTPVPGEKEEPGAREWQEALAAHAAVSNTLSLDSYSRCWLQELVLFDEIGRVIPEVQRDDYRELAGRVQAAHRERFDASVAAIAAYLLRLAADKVELGANWQDTLQDLWGHVRKWVPLGKADASGPHARAMETLAQRFMEETRAATDTLIGINRLSGVSAGEIVEAAGEKFSIEGPVDESASALAGGVISGALAGLGADLLAGGLTLGSGALVGGVLGALGSAAVARGYNIRTRRGSKVIAWSPASLTEAFAKAVMLYLAIAHFGRGQGEWRRRQDPEHWTRAVGEAMDRHRDRLAHLWARAAAEGEMPPTRNEGAGLLRDCIGEVLRRLYPESAGYL